MLTRRLVAKLSLAPLIGAVAGAADRGALASDNGLSRLEAALLKIEAESGGRLGVAVLDMQRDASAGHRVNERFPMCSTFKVLLVAAILAKIDAGKERLGRRIRIEPSDILSYAPVTKQHTGDGDMTVGELCESAVMWSDNTAANLLLGSIGGPAAVTSYVRSLGDETTRLDRIEPDLNESTPGDVRDTTTPLAMAANFRSLATGSALSDASREQLVAWLVGCRTGDAKLRAGLPKSWRVGDKTGSGQNGSSNDVAVIWPDGRKPLIVASYLTETAASDDQRSATHAAVARAVVAALA